MKTDIAKPLLKWPGGKRRVLKYIEEYIPETYETYVEPFFGGGAMYFYLQPSKAVINDYNEELVNVYKTVRDNPKGLINELRKDKYSNNLESFLNIRALDRDDTEYAGLSSTERAARTLYLNRTCFNGLYRVNSKNQFNVPFGKYDNPKIIDEDNILAVHELFSNEDQLILSGDYLKALDEVRGSSSNFIYLDPPYVPLTETASFISYTDKGFDIEDQIELRDLALEMNDSKNYVLLSNSDTPIIRELYQDFFIIPINVQRSVGAKASTRVGVGEVLILGSYLATNKGIAIV